MAYLPASTIASNALYTVTSSDPVLFGFVQSAMFMAWVRTVSGRLKSDLQIAPGPVYNTFAFPSPTPRQRERVQEAAESVLRVRAAFQDASLGDLYALNATPPQLTQAHDVLDRAVDSIFKPRGRLTSDGDQMSVLFNLYVDLQARGQLPGTSRGSEAPP